MRKLFSWTQLILVTDFFCHSNCLATTAVMPKDINVWNSDKITDTDVTWQTPQSGQYLRIKPTLNLWGFVGKRGIAKAQGFVPFGGDGVESIFFGVVDGAGSYAKEAGYSGGLGGGYRKIFDGTYFLGGYLMADYNRTPNSKNFLTVNPGFEALANTMDFRLNGYIPCGGSNWIDNSSVIKNGKLFKKYEEAGPGFDGEVGSIVPLPHVNGLRLYAGGYHFFMAKTSNVTGIEGRLVYPIWNWLGFEMRDSYDNVKKNALMFGFRATFGGYTDEEKQGLGIAGRLSDPIEHNLGNFASGNTAVVNTQLVSAK